ncbi:hypothetical protein [Metabacillus litoralis]|uniref:hypothetical protein n=1 Tax=Metabacillus litoralis TaxID=152268 RepID=UPI00203AF8C7|nr:hypothetical protein [Metabacillus litoralis]MCM3162289.1 hypothetical protein [Metabacillus litoralis]
MINDYEIFMLFKLQQEKLRKIEKHHHWVTSAKMIKTKVKKRKEKNDLNATCCHTASCC